jgi:competence protein ComEC
MSETGDSTTTDTLSASSTTGVEIVFLDVGQGDATLVVDHGSKAALLIDCPAGREYVIEQALQERSCRLTTAIITHWDLDHFGGILGVLDGSDVESLRFNHDTLIAHGKETRIIATLRRLRDRRYNHIEFGDAKQGLTGFIGSVRYELLAPSHRQLLDAVSTSDRNLASGVVLVEANGTRVLIGGDADGRVWSRIIAEGIMIKAKALKWPHHGALKRTTGRVDDQQLLEAVEPSVVVFSAGSRNVYGHPLPAAVRRIAQRGIGVMCTQVTERCHAGLNQNDVACAGTVSLMLSPGGEVTSSPSMSKLAQLIDGWTRPLCRYSATSGGLAAESTKDPALLN